MATLNMYLVGGTEKAYLLSSVKKGEKPDKSTWVPRSVIKSIVKFPAETGAWQEVIVTIEDWFAEKKNLI